MVRHLVLKAIVHDSYATLQDDDDGSIEELRWDFTVKYENMILKKLTHITIFADLMT